MIHSEYFFNGWEGVVRVVVLAALGYLSLLVMLRASRKRTLAQMNVFDFVYIIIIGELIAITIMDDRVSLAQGLAGVGVLLLFQVLFSWLTTRSSTVERVINGEPTLLMRRGRFLHDAMQGQRVTEKEVISAVRAEGVADLEQVEAVVLETNGGFSVIHFGTPSNAPTLADVPGGGAGSGQNRGRPAPRAERREPAHAEGAAR